MPKIREKQEKIAKTPKVQTMPAEPTSQTSTILAAYIGYTCVSVAVEGKDGTFTVSQFPYIYSKDLFNEFVDESHFYTQVLGVIAKDFKIKLSDCDILLTGFLNAPTLIDSLNPKLVKPLHELLSSCDSYYPVLVNNSGILTKDSLLSNVPCDFLSKNDFYANLSIYPQLITRDYNEQTNLDSILVDKVNKNQLVITSEKQIVFTGDRFSQNDTQPLFKYALALDLFSSPGFYFFSIDKSNSLILDLLIKAYNPAKHLDMTQYLETVGTLAVVPGASECLVTTDLETKQFFELSNDELFILPLDQNLKTKISLKSKTMGNLEGAVPSGTLGLILDTREERRQLVSDLKVMNSFIKQIEEVEKGL